MISTLLLLALTGTSTPADATQLATVEVTSLRNPQVFDIDSGVAARNRFNALSIGERDALAMAFYVLPEGKQASIDFSQIDLGLDTGEGYVDLPLASTGRLDFPEVKPSLVKQSEIFSNQPKGSLKIVYKVDIAADAPDRLSVAQAKRAVSQARNAWKTVLPGIARMTVPKFNCVEFQFVGQGDVFLATAGETSPNGHGESVRVPLADIPASADAFTWSGQLARIAACKD